MCVAGLLPGRALTGVSRRGSLSVAVIREQPRLGGESRLLEEKINGRLPYSLWKSEAIEEDDKESTGHIPFKEFVRNGSVGLGRESNGRHVEEWRRGFLCDLNTGLACYKQIRVLSTSEYYCTVLCCRYEKG